MRLIRWLIVIVCALIASQAVLIVSNRELSARVQYLLTSIDLADAAHTQRMDALAARLEVLDGEQ